MLSFGIPRYILKRPRARRRDWQKDDGDAGAIEEPREFKDMC